MDQLTYSHRTVDPKIVRDMHKPRTRKPEFLDPMDYASDDTLPDFDMEDPELFGNPVEGQQEKLLAYDPFSDTLHCPFDEATTLCRLAEAKRDKPVPPPKTNETAKAPRSGKQAKASVASKASRKQPPPAQDQQRPPVWHPAFAAGYMMGAPDPRLFAQSMRGQTHRMIGPFGWNPVMGAAPIPDFHGFAHKSGFQRGVGRLAARGIYPALGKTRGMGRGTLHVRIAAFIWHQRQQMDRVLSGAESTSPAEDQMVIYRAIANDYEAEAELTNSPFPKGSISVGTERTSAHSFSARVISGTSITPFGTEDEVHATQAQAEQQGASTDVGKTATELKAPQSVDNPSHSTDALGPAPDASGTAEQEPQAVPSDHLSTQQVVPPATGSPSHTDLADVPVHAPASSREEARGEGVGSGLENQPVPLMEQDMTEQHVGGDGGVGDVGNAVESEGVRLNMLSVLNSKKSTPAWYYRERAWARAREDAERRRKGHLARVGALKRLLEETTGEPVTSVPWLDGQMVGDKRPAATTDTVPNKQARLDSTDAPDQDEAGDTSPPTHAEAGDNGTTAPATVAVPVELFAAQGLVGGAGAPGLGRVIHNLTPQSLQASGLADAGGGMITRTSLLLQLHQRQVSLQQALKQRKMSLAKEIDASHAEQARLMQIRQERRQETTTGGPLLDVHVGEAQPVAVVQSTVVQPTKVVQPNTVHPTTVVHQVQPTTVVPPPTVIQPTTVVQPGTLVQPTAVVQATTVVQPASVVQPGTVVQSTVVQSTVVEPTPMDTASNPPPVTLEAQ